MAAEKAPAAFNAALLGHLEDITHATPHSRL